MVISMIKINIDSPITIDEKGLKKILEKKYGDSDIDITHTPVNKKPNKRKEKKKYNRRRT